MEGVIRKIQAAAAVYLKADETILPEKIGAVGLWEKENKKQAVLEQLLFPVAVAPELQKRSRTMKIELHASFQKNLANKGYPLGFSEGSLYCPYIK